MRPLTSANLKALAIQTWVLTVKHPDIRRASITAPLTGTAAQVRDAAVDTVKSLARAFGHSPLALDYSMVRA